jgi:hypothetical protein
MVDSCGGGHKRLMKDFYDQVWPEDFDYTSITRTSTTTSDESGYSHVPSVPLHKLLRACPFLICSAFNSPVRHVKHVPRRHCCWDCAVQQHCGGNCDSRHGPQPRRSATLSNVLHHQGKNPAAFFGDLFVRQHLPRDESCWMIPN